MNPVVLVSGDLQSGVFKRYRRGANGKPIHEATIRIEPWAPVMAGLVAIDPDAIERFRMESTAFQEVPLSVA